MSSLPAVVSRLNSLTSSHRQTQSLIHHLEQLSRSDNIDDEDLSDLDTVRTEIASDVQQSLKDQEEEFEVLKLDVEDLIPTPTGTNGTVSRLSGVGVGNLRTKRPGEGGERENERDRIVAQVHKLGEDLRLYVLTFLHS